MRISNWSSDVCSSDLVAVRVFRRRYHWLVDELERDDIWLIQRGFFFGRFSDSYVDAPYGKGFVVAMALIGCFHMSGLFVRCFECLCPRWKSAGEIPNHVGARLTRIESDGLVLPLALSFLIIYSLCTLVFS